MTLEELHATVVEGFTKVDERFDAFRQEIRQEIGGQMGQFRGEFEGRLREEHEAMRRHFDVMVERVEAAVRIVAEGHGHHRTILDDHEVRLQAIEKRT
jgi:hypothetical protein